MCLRIVRAPVSRSLAAVADGGSRCARTGLQQRGRTEGAQVEGVRIRDQVERRAQPLRAGQLEQLQCSPSPN